MTFSYWAGEAALLLVQEKIEALIKTQNISGYPAQQLREAVANPDADSIRDLMTMMLGQLNEHRRKD